MIDIEQIKNEIASGELEPVERNQSEGATGYQIWKVTVKTFEAVGIKRETPLTSQYVYNFLKNREPKGAEMKNRRYSEEEVNQLVRILVKRNLQYRVEK